MPSDTISAPEHDLVWTKLTPPTPRAGLIARAIAADLYVSVSTVRSQVQAIYRKLEVSSRAGAVDRARELGLISPR